MIRYAAAFLAGVLVTLLVVGPVQSGQQNCRPAWKCQPSGSPKHPTPRPSATRAPTVAPPATVLPTAVPTAAPTANPGAVVVQFPGGGPATPAALVALMRVEQTDVIEWAAGTYPQWAAFLDVARTRPLLIRPKGDVIWDGTGTINTPPFRVGWSSKASNFTLDPSGTGTFTAQNYKLGKIGLVTIRYGENLGFNGIKVRNVEGGYGDGIPGAAQHTHGVYVSTDGVHRSKNLTFDDWDVIGPASLMLNGLHIYGGPSVDGVHAHGWKVSRLHRAMYVWAAPTGVDIADWDMTDVRVTVDNYPNQAQGTVRNSRSRTTGTVIDPATGQPIPLAPLAPGKGHWRAGPLVDGGGNTAS